MTTQMTEAMKSAKTLQAEMTQWENRLESTRQEQNNLKRQSEMLQAEIDKKRMDFENYIAAKEVEVRNMRAKLLEDQKVLDGQREEFRVVLDSHSKEKQALAQDKLVFARDQASLNGQKVLVNDFIQAVRRAYNLIAP